MATSSADRTRRRYLDALTRSDLSGQTHDWGNERWLISPE
jgi:hypothetical protein